MKKCLIAVLLTIVLSAMLTCAFAATDDSAAWEDQLFLISQIRNETEETEPETVSAVLRLPSSLRIIEDEAFESTAIISADFPETLESIGEHAFADIPTLRSIRIPENTKQIAKTAFAGSNGVTITGVPGSYARTWAKENGIPFAPVTVMTAGGRAVQISADNSHRQDFVHTDKEASSGKAQNDSWRPFTEIQSERYDAWFTNHISGRAPPACA